MTISSATAPIHFMIEMFGLRDPKFLLYFMQVLTSPQNPLLKSVRKALQRGGLTDDGLCVAEGFHLLDEALRSNCEVANVFAAESVVEKVEGLKAARVTALPDGLFNSISSSEASQGVVSLVRPPSWQIDDLFRGRPLMLVLDGVQDPGNGGAMIRSAEAFGATGVAFLKGSVNPYNPKCLRGSAGSVFRQPLVTGIDGQNFWAAAEGRKIRMYVLDAGAAMDIGQAAFDQPCALVVGSEGRGVSEYWRSGATPVKIPTLAVESLNAATAAGIALYEARRQRMANP